MDVTFSRSKEGLPQASFPGDRWEDFRAVIGYFKARLGGRVLTKTEGPGARTWRLEVGDNELVVQQLDTGGLWVSGIGMTSESLIRQIVSAIQELSTLDELNPRK